MNVRSRTPWIVALVVGVACLVVLSEPPRRASSGPHRRPLLPRKELLQVVGAGHQVLIADYFWIMTIQALGLAGNAEEYRDVYDYADLVTDLDPDFRYVYAFAGPAVTYHLGREVWANTAESSRLLEKGLKAFPKDIFLRVMYAYNLSYFDKQYLRAAKLLEDTSRLPGAPPYVAALATRLYAQSGAIDSGLEMAQALVASAGDPETRATFERRVHELELERELLRMDKAIAAFRAREGRLPSIEELVTRGFIRSIPDDPLGGKLYVGEDGRARSTSEEQRLEVHK